MERVPKSGEFYRHFKNKLYQILTVAEHSETREKLVIYQALYGEFKTYARPLEMFVSEVDHQKYPDVTQKYRFERVENPGECVAENDINLTAATVQMESVSRDRQIKNGKGITDAGQIETAKKAEAVKAEITVEKSDGYTDSESIDDKIMAFLDTDDFDERYNILVSMRDSITDIQINNLAVVLDVVIPEGKIDDRYEQLKMCLRTKQKYESVRLR